MATEIDVGTMATGIVCGLVLKNVQSLTYESRRFDRAMESAYGRLSGLAEAEDLELNFRIKLHPIHRDSETAHEGLTFLMGGLISMDAPRFDVIRIRLDRHGAEHHLSWLCGSRELWLHVTEAFLASHRGEIPVR